jgi:hypothetical protein
MNKILITTLIIFLIVFGFYKYQKKETKLNIYKGNAFTIDSPCKNLALLGCTPHPTNYLQDKDNKLQTLRNIKLADFLDIDYLRDSFERTFAICKNNNVDHLVIAYLPIYFIGLKQMLGEQFIEGCNAFFDNIIPDVKNVIKATSDKMGFVGKITLIIPTDFQLEKVPLDLIDIAQRIRYLIKQFPKLGNLQELQTITIINNKVSDEDDKLIDYLRYE